MHVWESLPLLVFGLVLAILGSVLYNHGARGLALIFFLGSGAMFVAPLVVSDPGAVA